MRRTCMRTILCAGIAILPLVALGGDPVDMEVENRSVIRGTLDPTGEAETFRIDVPEGANLFLRTRSRGGGMKTAPFDPSGGSLGDATGTGMTFISASPTAPGLYRVDVSNIGARPRNYRIDLSWRFPRSVPFSGDAGPDSWQVPFHAEAGSVARFACGYSAGTPRLLRIEGPDGYRHDFDPPRREKAWKHRAKTRLPTTGAYTLTVGNGGNATPMEGFVTLRAPRKRVKINVRDRRRRAR